MHERIVQIIESWSQQIGLVRPSDAAAAVSLGDSGPKADARRYEMLHRLTGIAHAQERFDRLAASVDEITAYTRPSTRGPLPLTGSLSESDQAVVAKSTRCQTLLVRLHRELSDAADALARAPCQAAPPAGGGRKGGVPARVEMGLGPAQQVSADFRPTSGGSSGGTLASGVGPPMLPAQRDALLHFAVHERAKLESLGAQIEDALGDRGSALWRSYFAVRGCCCVYPGVAASHPSVPRCLPVCRSLRGWEGTLRWLVARAMWTQEGSLALRRGCESSGHRALRVTTAAVGLLHLVRLQRLLQLRLLLVAAPPDLGAQLVASLQCRSLDLKRARKPPALLLQRPGPVAAAAVAATGPAPLARWSTRETSRGAALVRRCGPPWGTGPLARLRGGQPVLPVELHPLRRHRCLPLLPPLLLGVLRREVEAHRQLRQPRLRSPRPHNNSSSGGLRGPRLPLLLHSPLHLRLLLRLQPQAVCLRQADLREG